MTANLGTADRIIRALIGLALVLGPLANLPAIWSSAALAYTSIAIGLILIGTSLVRFCPLYRVLGISTCRI